VSSKFVDGGPGRPAVTCVTQLFASDTARDNAVGTGMGGASPATFPIDYIDPM